ncbi:MAG TPA: hypothetical protein VGI99_04755 [Gemmataceae bacterium]
MDQDAMVIDQFNAGQRLVEELRKIGFDLAVAFWARPTEEGRWYLFLATPIVDVTSQAAAYRTVGTTLRAMPELGIDFSEIRVLDRADLMAQAAIAVAKSKGISGRIRFNGSSLGRTEVDGASIYSLPEAA